MQFRELILRFCTRLLAALIACFFGGLGALADGSWSVSRTVTISHQGGAALLCGGTPAYLVTSPEDGTITITDPGTIYDHSSDFNLDAYVKHFATDPGAQVNAHVQYSFSFHPETAPANPTSMKLIVIASGIHASNLFDADYDHTGQDASHPTSAQSIVSSPWVSDFESDASRIPPSHGYQLDSSPPADPLWAGGVHVITMSWSIAHSQYEGTWEIDTSAEVDVIPENGNPLFDGWYACIWAEAKFTLLPILTGFAFPVDGSAPCPGCGCECGISSSDLLSGSTTAGGEFTVFSWAVPLRTDHSGPDGPGPFNDQNPFPPPFGNIGHWLSVHLEQGADLQAYWASHGWQHSVDADPSGRAGFSFVPLDITGSAPSGPSAPTVRSLGNSASQALGSISTDQTADFLIDADGSRVRLGSYVGSAKVECTFNPSTLTISNAGPPGAISSKGGWTYSFVTNTALTDGTPLPLLQHITDPFGNYVDITYPTLSDSSHTTGSIYFSLANESWTFDLAYNPSDHKAHAYLSALHRPGEDVLFTWAGDGRLGAYERQVSSSIVHRYEFSWDSANGLSHILSSTERPGDQYTTGLSTAYSSDTHTAKPFGSTGPSATYEDRMGYAKYQNLDTNVGSAHTQYERSQDGDTYMVHVTDPTSKVFDTMYKMTSEDAPGIDTITSVFGPLNGASKQSKVVTTIDQYDRTTKVEWDRTTGTAGIQLGYDGYSDRVTSMSFLGASSDVWSTTWGTHGGEPSVTQTTDPTGNAWSFGYGESNPGSNPAAAMTSITAPWPSAKWNFTYASTGLPLTSKAPGRAADQMTYYGGSNHPEWTALPKSYTDPTGKVSYFDEYDSRKNLTKTAFLDDSSNKVTTQYIYDGFGNLSGIDHPDTSRGDPTFTYMGSMLAQATDEAGRTVHIDRYDPDNANQGKVKQIWFTSSSTDLFAYLGYDDAGRLTQVWDGNHAADTDTAETTLDYGYGDAGELKEIKYRTGTGQDTETFSYNPEGTVKSRTTTANHTIGYSYDAVKGWLTGIDYPNDTDVSFTYDVAGRPLTVTDQAGTITYTYDSYKRLQKIRRDFSALSGKHYDIEYSYNADGTVAWEKTGLVQSGFSGDKRRTTTYTYDDAGRMIKLEVAPPPSGSFSFSGPGNPNDIWEWTYDNAGRMKTETDPSGAVTTYTYKANDDLSFLTDVNIAYSGTSIMDFAYADNPDASVYTEAATTGSSSANGTVTYGYDARGQLYTESRTGGTAFSRTYNYDQSGNLSTLVEGSNSSTWATSYNQITGVTGTPAYSSFQYGTSGALDQYNDGTGTWTYSYDDEDRLKQATCTGPSVTYTVDKYDAFGRPAVETVGGVTHYLVWEGDQLILEFDSNGTSGKRYIWGAGGFQGIYPGTNLGSIALRDGLGNVRGLMTKSRSVTDRYVYDAYGNPKYTSGSTYNPFRWNGDYGYRYLPTVNVLHAGSRHYSSQLKRWLERDALDIRGGEPNIYVYELDPVNYVDADGFSGESKQGKKGKQVDWDKYLDDDAWHGHQPANKQFRQELKKVALLLNIAVECMQAALPGFGEEIVGGKIAAWTLKAATK